MTESHTAILSIDCLYVLKGKDIYKFRKKYMSPESVFKRLPYWTINTNEGANNRIRSAEEFLYYVGTIDDSSEEKYFFFNLSTSDSVLNEEIAQAGLDEMFKDIDFKKILSVFTPDSFERLDRGYLPSARYLIVTVNYEMSKDFEYGWECDNVYSTIDGYLDKDFNKKTFEE